MVPGTISPWVTNSLAHFADHVCACERWTVAAQLAGVLGSAGGTTSVAPPELSGRAARGYEEAIADTRAALGEPAFNDQADAGKRITREQAIEPALAE